VLNYRVNFEYFNCLFSSYGVFSCGNLEIMNPLFQWDVFMVERNVRKMVLAAIGPLWDFCNIRISMNNAKTTYISFTVTAFHISDPQAKSKWGDICNCLLHLHGFSV